MSRTPGRRRSFTKLAAGLTATAALTVATLVATALPAAAFKPYTHNATAENAYDDVVADGKVTINGTEYTVRADDRHRSAEPARRLQRRRHRARRLPRPGLRPVGDPPRGDRQVAATTARRGVGRTGRREPADAEKQQILAFAYGFMTHAAGDMWAHTLVNEFAEGVFPGRRRDPRTTTRPRPRSRCGTSSPRATSAMRPPGFDGNPSAARCRASRTRTVSPSTATTPRPRIDYCRADRMDLRDARQPGQRPARRHVRRRTRRRR